MVSTQPEQIAGDPHQVTGAAAVGTQHRGEEQEKGTQGLIETPED